MFLTRGFGFASLSLGELPLSVVSFVYHVNLQQWFLHWDSSSDFGASSGVLVCYTFEDWTFFAGACDGHLDGFIADGVKLVDTADVYVHNGFRRQLARGFGVFGAGMGAYPSALFR